MYKRMLLVLFICGCLTACKKTLLPTDPQQVAVQAVIDDGVIQQYLKSNNLTGQFRRDSTGFRQTGVYYRVDTLGNGGVYTYSTLVTVGYTGKILGSNNIFSQTNQNHPAFNLGQMILGWQYGIPHVKKGGRVRLLIPSTLAYGPYPQPELNLPANSVLDFTINVYDITN